ncbi:MAG: efflux RND transporter periplasmic adaptor subunit [Cyanobacteria bacterium K_Offshore_surface_m2_239]|nr:efflux RND transporter periplasmic adaptor subunit [Cyanobacteria bacterium K_Offshore_surface_m2_239]
MSAPRPLRTLEPVAPLPPPVTPIAPRPLPQRSPRSRRPLWIGLAALLALLAGLGLWQRQRATARQDITPYTVVARSGSLPGVVTASGELDAVERVNVSPKRQGQLLELLVQEGERVEKGQPIARMDAGDLSDRLEELRANLLSAKAELARSRGELERNLPLYRQGAISLNDLQRFQADYQVKTMAVAAAQQRIQQRRVEQEELIVRAPFPGVISQRFAEPGAFVTPTTAASATAGATSSSIVELSQGLEAIAKVPESDLGRLRIGLPADVRVDSFPDRRFPARIRQIAPRAVKQNNVTSFEVKLELLNPPPELRIGMTADIDFQTGALPSRTLVPTVAVVTEKGRPGVLLVGKDRKPTFQPVELGVSSGKDTQILSGLSSGTRVFIDLPPWAKERKS